MYAWMNAVYFRAFLMPTKLKIDSFKFLDLRRRVLVDTVSDPLLVCLHSAFFFETPKRTYADTKQETGLICFLLCLRLYGGVLGRGWLLRGLWECSYSGLFFRLLLCRHFLCTLSNQYMESVFAYNNCNLGINEFPKPFAVYCK